jgi:hypothetical protein
MSLQTIIFSKFALVRMTKRERKEPELNVNLCEQNVGWQRIDERQHELQ